MSLMGDTASGCCALCDRPGVASLLSLLLPCLASSSRSMLVLACKQLLLMRWVRLWMRTC
jgi:hypothetical protein